MSSSMLALAIRGSSDNGLIKNNKSAESRITKSQELLEEYFEEESDLLLRLEPLSSKTVEKVLSCEDLIKTIYDSENSFSKSNLDARSVFIDKSIDSLVLMAAEEDGTPMDDLPEFSRNSNVLNSGVKDFVLVDKSDSSSKPVLQLHLRCVSDADSDSGSNIPRKRGSGECDSDNSDASIDDIYTVPSVSSDRFGDDSENERNSSDHIPIFQTESDEDMGTKFPSLQVHSPQSEKFLSHSPNGLPMTAVQELQSWKSQSAIGSLSPFRASGNIIITCCSPGNDHRWKAASTISVSVSANSAMKVRTRSHSIIRSDSCDWKSHHPSPYLPSRTPTPSRPHTHSHGASFMNGSMSLNSSHLSASIPIGLDLSAMTSPVIVGSARKPRSQSLPDLHSPREGEDSGSGINLNQWADFYIGK